jgi:RNA polymerase sigma-70 factor, ECF subfamily
LTERSVPLEPEYTAWVSALKRREPSAWVRLQRRTLEAVFGYVFLRCGRREDAEDVTAEVFAAALASIDGFRGDARVETWLIGIARRKLIDAARRRDRRPEVLEAELYSTERLGLESDGDTPHEALERRDQSARVRTMVLQLPDAQREALWLHCVDQFSLAETARVMGRSENAVKGLIHRARLTIRERLAETEAAPTQHREKNHVESTLSSALPAAPTSGK